MVHQIDMLLILYIHIEQFLNLLATLFGQHGNVVFLINRKINILLQLAHCTVHNIIFIGGASAGPDMISGVRASSIRMLSLVHDGIIQVRWTLVFFGNRHVITQIIKAKLIIGSGDVGHTLPALLRVHVMLNCTNTSAPETRKSDPSIPCHGGRDSH